MYAQGGRADGLANNVDRNRRPPPIQGENQQSSILAKLNPLTFYKQYHLACRAAANTIESALSGCNALTGNTGTKHTLAKVTTGVAGANALMRFYDAYRSYNEHKPGQCFRHVACVLIDVAISGCFNVASAKTGTDEKMQDDAKILAYSALAASVVKLILDLVFDCIEIHNLSINQVNERVENYLEEGRGQPLQQLNLNQEQRDRLQGELPGMREEREISFKVKSTLYVGREIDFKVKVG